jgi:molybdate transport system regulatory protein
MSPTTQFRLRIYRDGGIAVGPGKVALVEAIAATGSISAAARSMGMSYRRAWLLVDELNRALKEPAVVGTVGGRRGGGATVTAAGSELVRRYRAIERAARTAAARDIAALNRMLVD